MPKKKYSLLNPAISSLKNSAELQLVSGALIAVRISL